MSILLNGVYSKYDDPINLLDPQIIAAAKVAELNRFQGTIFNRTQAPTVSHISDTFQVYSRTASDLKSVVGTAGWDATSTTGLDIDPNKITSLVPNSTVMVGTEMLIIKAQNISASTIDVYARGHGNTTASEHTAGTGINIFGSAINSQDLKNMIGRQEKTIAYENYMQHLFEIVEWDEDDQSQDRKVYGNPEVKRQEAIIRMFKQLTQTIITGRKSIGTAGMPQTTGGLIDQLTDVNGIGGTTRTLQTMAIGGAFTENALITGLESAIKSGTANTIMVSWKNQKVLNTLDRIVGGKEATDMSQSLNRRGQGGWANYYEYAGQLFEVLCDEAMPDDKVVIGDISKIKRGFRQDSALRITTEPTRSSAESREALRGHFGVSVENAETDFVTLTDLT